MGVVVRRYIDFLIIIIFLFLFYMQGIECSRVYMCMECSRVYIHVHKTLDYVIVHTTTI